MGKNPAVLFYPSDFLAGTLLMTNEEVGAYIKLLCLQRERGHLPRDVILHICGREMPAVLEKLDVDEQGLYYNARMDEEIAKRDKFCESRRESVQARYVRNTYELRMGNGNRNINSTNLYNNSLDRGSNKYLGDDAQNAHSDAQNAHNLNTKNAHLHTSDVQKCTQNAHLHTPKARKCTSNAQFEQDFAQFWNAYPRRENKQRAIAAFKKLAPDADLMAQMIAAIERQKKSDQWTRDNGQYIPHPTTWLNGRRWEDELPTPTRYGTFNISDAFNKAIERSYQEKEK